MDIVENIQDDIMELEQDSVPQYFQQQQQPLAKVNIPEFLKVDRTKRFQVVNQLNYDQDFPFSTDEFFGATKFNGAELATQAQQIDFRSQINLPYWEYEIKNNQFRLNFSCNSNYEQYLLTKQDEKDEIQVSEEYKHRHRQREEDQENQQKDKNSPSRSRDFETEEIVITYEDNLRIENLPISQQTKDLIREKYFRGASHSDLENFKVFDKNTASLFYELFSVIFREKPIFEFEDVITNTKGPKEYIAHLVFNHERLVHAQSNSKKDAKALASLLALEIFAPSLAGKHQHFVKVPESNVRDFLEDIKPHEILKEPSLPIMKKEKQPPPPKREKQPPPPKKIKQPPPTKKIKQPPPTKKENVPKQLETKPIIEEEEIQNNDKVVLSHSGSESDDVVEIEMNDTQIITNSNFEEEEEETQNSILFNNLPNINNTESNTNTFFEYNEEDMKATLNEFAELDKKSPPLQDADKPIEKNTSANSEKNEVQVNFNSVSGLKVTIPAAVTDKENRKSDSNQQHPLDLSGRNMSIKKLFDDLSDVMKNLLKPRIDPKASYTPDLAKALKSYCQHRIFTKLYMLHCLIHKKEKETLQISSLYYENECHVYLYSTELNQTFMYRSNSFVFSVEAAKYFLMFTLYNQCLTVPEIISKMKAQKDQLDLSSEYEKLNKSNPSLNKRNISDKTNILPRLDENKPTIQSKDDSDEIEEIESSTFLTTSQAPQNLKDVKLSDEKTGAVKNLPNNIKRSANVKDRMIEDLDDYI